MIILVISLTNQKNTFFYNTLLLLISTILIKILGLINRIAIARILGPENMDLYILAFPTIIFFISIASGSLNQSLSKTVSEGLKTKLYSPRKLLKKSFKIAIAYATLASILLLVIYNTLINDLLKNNELYIPLCTTFILIFLVGISDALKGFFNGYKKMIYSSISSFLEQLARIIFSISFLIILLPYGKIIATTATLLALSFGEIISIIYSFSRLKKIPKDNFKTSDAETKEILKISIPSTFARILGSFTYFLEPIIYTLSFTVLNYDLEEIINKYTIYNAYTIPFLTMASFIPLALSQSIMPLISENYSVNNFPNLHELFRKLLKLSLIPGVFASIIIFFYHKELMTMIYGTNVSSSEIKIFVFFLLPYYLEMPFISFLNSINEAKYILWIGSIFNFLKLILLFFLPRFNLGPISLLIATTISLNLFVLSLFIKIKKKIKFKFNFPSIFNCILVLLDVFLICLLTKAINLQFIIAIFLCLLIFLFLSYKYKIIYFRIGPNKP